MNTLIILGSIILAGVIIFQIARITEMMNIVRGEDPMHEERMNTRIAAGIVALGVFFLVYTLWSAHHFKNMMMGYGPLKSASLHGFKTDHLFNIITGVTGVVFIATHILLIYFVWKYRYRSNRKAKFIPENNKLEIIWTAVPTAFMLYLIFTTMVLFNEVTADVTPKDNHIEIEATGMQFAWIIRYPGKDNKLGSKDYKLISGDNSLGQDWNDPKNLDDVIPDEIVLPKGRKVKVRIGSRDVLHSFFLPHFRVKMDAVPGTPTSFVFTPSITTAEYRQNLKKYPEWNVPADPKDPTGKKRWETFNFELACAELCGNSHFSMRKVVKVVTEKEYETWLRLQTPYYQASIKGTDNDPMMKGKSNSTNTAQTDSVQTNENNVPASSESATPADSTK